MAGCHRKEDEMAIDIASRLLAVAAAVAFTVVLTTGRLPVIPRGRWTFVVLFGLGLTMCTIAGFRDGLGTTSGLGAWQTSIQAAIGISAFALLLAVLIGFDWRLGVVILGLQTAASWLLAMTQTFTTDPVKAGIGVAALAAALVAAAITWDLSGGGVNSNQQTTN
jgi:hypothetical protein